MPRGVGEGSTSLPEQTYAGSLREMVQKTRERPEITELIVNLRGHDEPQLMVGISDLDAIADALEKAATLGGIINNDSGDWRAMDLLEALAALDRRAGREEQG